MRILQTWICLANWLMATSLLLVLKCSKYKGTCLPMLKILRHPLNKFELISTYLSKMIWQYHVHHRCHSPSALTNFSHGPPKSLDSVQSIDFFWISEQFVEIEVPLFYVLVLLQKTFHALCQPVSSSILFPNILPTIEHICEILWRLLGESKTSSLIQEALFEPSVVWVGQVGTLSFAEPSWKRTQRHSC